MVVKGITVYFITVRPVLTLHNYVGAVPTVDDTVIIATITYKVMRRVWDFADDQRSVQVMIARD